MSLSQVLRKLAKKYYLSTKKYEKAVIYVEDLIEYL
jgi:hypothetical protein